MFSLICLLYYLNVCIQGSEAQPDEHLHATSAKPVMTKLQNLFVGLVNMDIFQMTLKFSLFTDD